LLLIRLPFEALLELEVFVLLLDELLEAPFGKEDSCEPVFGPPLEA
jgi:hypothetical protein